VWESYLEQPSVRITQGARAHLCHGRGVTVAIIDTRIGLIGSGASGPRFRLLGDWPEETGISGGGPSIFSREPRSSSRQNPGPKRAPPGAPFWAGDEQEPGSRHDGCGSRSLMAPRPGSACRCSQGTAAPTGRDRQGDLLRRGPGARQHELQRERLYPSPAVNYAARQGDLRGRRRSGQAAMVYPLARERLSRLDRRYDHRAATTTGGRHGVAAPGRIVTTYLDGAYAVGWGTSSAAPCFGRRRAPPERLSSLDQYAVARLLAQTAERTIDDPDQGRVDLWRAALAAAISRSLERAAASGPRR
jgi:hypothetical protein